MNRVKDPRLGFASVTDVEVTEDLKLARAFISVLKPEERETTMKILDSAKGFIRAELAKRLRMKFIPSLEFRLDTTSDYASRIECLLKEIKEKH